MSKTKQQKPKTPTKSKLEGETLKRFVVNGVIYYFLYDWKPRGRVYRYVFVALDPSSNDLPKIINVTVHSMLRFLKRCGLGMHDAQQIKYDITGTFGK